MSGDLIIKPHNKISLLRNIHCAYCGMDFKDSFDKEHVIGKRFVPIGTMNLQWNLLLRSCKPCNQIKSTFEHDISGVSLFLALQSGLVTDEMIAKINNKTSKCYSSKTKRPVSDSSENTTIQTQTHSLKTTFKLIAPPQVEQERAFSLALYQLKGFYYFLTFNESINLGLPIPGAYAPLDFSPRGDWGNAVQVSFATKVKEWKTCFICPTANGFFKCIIKRHPNTSMWAWAIEWNKIYRTVGLFGDKQSIQDFVSTLQKRTYSTIQEPDGVVYLCRDEILNPENDFLFYVE